MHTIVMVPEGHTVQVHPPGVVPQPGLPAAPTGMIPGPADGAKAAMDAVMPAEKPKAKKPAKKAEPKAAAKKEPAKKS